MNMGSVYSTATESSFISNSITAMHPSSLLNNFRATYIAPRDPIRIKEL